VSEEGGDGEDAGSETPSLLSYTLIHVSLRKKIDEKGREKTGKKDSKICAKLEESNTATASHSSLARQKQE
jgi:hypothetical protein